MLLLTFVEDCLCDARCGNCGGPACVEGQMRDELGELSRAEAMVERASQVNSELLGPMSSD